MCSPGINGEGELRGQLPNPGSPGKMAIKMVCVCVCVLMSRMSLTICTSSMQTVSVSRPRVSLRAAISSLRHARFTSLLLTSASGSSKLNNTQHCCSFRTTRPGWSPAAVSETVSSEIVSYTTAWYGIVEFNIPLDTV